MIYRNGYYYLFYNKGGCCAGIASTYYMVMGRSTSPKGPFLDKSGKALRLKGQPSGGTIVLKHDNSRGTEDRYFGPGHFGLFSENGVDYVTFHYYDPNGFYPNPAVNNQGGPTLGLAKLVWDEDGWPSISFDFVNEGVYQIENIYSKKVADAFNHTIADSTSIFQYAADTTLQTQKWVFKTLGSGEYSISSYASPDMYIETGGIENTPALFITSEYEGLINQRFRTVTSPAGKTIIYPSTKDVGWGLTTPTSSDVKIVLRTLIAQDYLRWNLVPFQESLLVSETKLTVGHSAGTDSSIFVESNGLWNASVLYETWLNVDFSGAGNDSLKISFSANTDTNDRKNRVYVTTNGGISKIINITQLGKPTATADEPNGNGFAVFPNPVNQDLFVECTKNGKLTVYNQTGQKVSEFNLSAGKNKLNVGNFQSGIYLLLIVADNKTVVRKIVKN